MPGAKKRKTHDSVDASAAWSSKRTRRSDDDGAKPSSHTQGPLDPVFGQRSALPGLEDFDPASRDDSALSDDDSGVGRQALRYLLAVRKEASLIPPVTAAPAPQTDDVDRSTAGIGDSRGFYADGAYTAAPNEDGEDEDEYDEDEEPDDTSPQHHFYEVTMARFHALRAQLATPVPPEATSRLDDDHGSLAEPTAHSSRLWLWRLKNTDPLPAQLARMDKGSVLRLLRLLSAGKGGLLAPTKAVAPRTSRWVWSLLARLPDRGELSSEEVGAVRELGKTAVRIAAAPRQKSVEEQVDQLVEDDETGDEKEKAASPTDEAVDLDAAKAKLLSQLSAPADADGHADSAAAELRVPNDATGDPSDGEDNNKRLTVEMILTVAGEVYGQRDLLEFREAWTDEEAQVDPGPETMIPI